MEIKERFLNYVSFDTQSVENSQTVPSTSKQLKLGKYLVEEREYIGLDTFPKDIEKEFSINRSTTSEMLKLMCKNGMITREEVDYDARLKKIVLTEASRQHNRNIEDKMRKMHQQLIKDLSDDEINAFIKISDKLINNIKEGL